MYSAFPQWEPSSMHFANEYTTNEYTTNEYTPKGIKWKLGYNGLVDWTDLSCLLQFKVSNLTAVLADYQQSSYVWYVVYVNLHFYKQRSQEKPIYFFKKSSVFL